MQTLAIILVLLSVLGGGACLVMLIISLLNKDFKFRPKKILIMWGGCFAIFIFSTIIGVATAPTNKDSKATVKAESEVKEQPKEKTEEEKTADEAKKKSDEEAKAKADAEAKKAKEEADTKKAAKDAKDNMPKEYQSALKKADLYANKMNLSKKGLYEQLTSDYGEKFPKEAAQYAVDNVKADWKKNALAKAKIYQDKMSMSKSSIHDQLVSDAGEKFTEEEAQYAMNNLEN